MEAKITNLIIAMVVVSLVAVGLGNYIDSVGVGHSVSDYNSSTLPAFNKLQELREDQKLSESAIRNVTEETTTVGIIRSSFSSLVQATKTAIKSMGIAISMVFLGVGNLFGLGDYAGVLLTSLIIIIIITIVIGYFLRILWGRGEH